MRARLLSNVADWAFAIFAAVPSGIVAGSLPTPRIHYWLPQPPGVTSRSASTTRRRAHTI
jgi:hypothetical protein